MSILNLDTSTRAQLTRTQTLKNANGEPYQSTTLCDLEGNALGPTDKPLPVYRDIITGNSFVQVAERIPTLQDSQSTDQRTKLQALNPVHYVSDDGSVNGWFLPMPKFDGETAAQSETKPETDAAK